MLAEVRPLIKLEFTIEVNNIALLDKGKTKSFAYVDLETTTSRLLIVKHNLPFT